MNDKNRHLLTRVANHLMTPRARDTGSLIGLALLKCTIDKVEDLVLDESTINPGEVIKDGSIYLSNWMHLLNADDNYVDLVDSYADFVLGYIIKGFREALNLKYVTLWFKVEEPELISNQNPYASSPIIYQKMKFSSPPEVEIAKALDRAGIMYLPNCLVRTGQVNARQIIIPDFLICHKGKWGMLEVDGKKYHTPESATKDHQRSQQIQLHTKLYVTRFPAEQCMREPDQVVRLFLSILEVQ